MTQDIRGIKCSPRLAPGLIAAVETVLPIYLVDGPPSIYRSKFNVALGIEAQGFCTIR